MNLKHSLIGRIAVGKLIGFLIGGLAFFMIPSVFPEAGIWLRCGVWAWYITLGAMVGLVGVITYHPVLKFQMPYWLRGIAMGAWMNFVLVLLLYPQLVVLLDGFSVGGVSFSNPFWFVVEGAILGLIMDWAATKYCGEGKDLV